MEGYPTHYNGPVCVIELQGDVDAAVACVLRQQLSELIRRGAHRLVLDFKRVPFADVAAVHVLADAAVLVNQRRGSLVFRDCSPPVAKLLRLVGLHGYIGGTSHNA